MTVPDFADPRPAYAQIASDLREQITSGRYEPGDRLPSNKALAVQYHVAPETIRGALDVLRSAGIIETQKTRGTFVLREPGEPEPSPEYLELSAAVKRLAERIDSVEARLAAYESDQDDGPR